MATESETLMALFGNHLIFHWISFLAVNQCCVELVVGSDLGCLLFFAVREEVPASSFQPPQG